MRSLSPTEMNEQQFRDWFAHSADVNIESFSFSVGDRIVELVLLYCEGMADLRLLNDSILPQLKQWIGAMEAVNEEQLSRNNTFPLQAIDATDGEPAQTLLLRLYSGELIAFFTEQRLLYSLNISNPPQRNPEESSTEVSIKGSRDAFTESLTTNVALIRKRLKTDSLCIEKMVIGQRSQTSVALLYMGDIIRSEVVEEARKHLAGLSIDILSSSSQLEQPSHSLFPLMDYIGRPDYVADCLVRGRFAILVDGSPMAVIGPSTLMLILKSPEDAYLPFYYVTLERLLRIIGLLTALFLPGFWMAVSSYNLDQLPFPMLATISSARSGLPFSGTTDFFLILILFELFREAGLRLPKAVGQTVAVVGGLIIGDAAIEAGLTGATTLVVAAVSIVSMFTLVNQSLAGTITMLRIVILIVSAFLGMYGFMLAVTGLVLYLSTLESFGIPYLAPLSPLNLRDIVSAVVAKPWKSVKRRPSFQRTIDSTRQGEPE